MRESIKLIVYVFVFVCLVIVVVLIEILIKIILFQENKDKIINTMTHEVLIWFGQPCLYPLMKEKFSFIP